MVNFWKRLPIIVLAIIIGFAFFACDEDDDIDVSLYIPDLVREHIISPGHAALQTFTDTTAAQLVANIGIGWNLGNTFDAHTSSAPWPPTTNQSVEALERLWMGHWSNYTTTEANIAAIKNAGFNTIRIPVTWYKVVNADYVIREDWLARVAQVINLAEANGMYVIINTHHDERIFKLTKNGVHESLRAFGIIWSQIAHQFRNYNDRLIFEALNEPRTIGAGHEWIGNPTEYAYLNKHYELFVNIVRESGGNNDRRILMLNTYAASASQQAMNGLKIPSDPGGSNRIIVSIHAYEPFDYAHGDLSVSPPPNVDWTPGAINGVMTRANSTFISKGYPVIIGEFGARQERHDTVRAREWAAYYVGEAKKRGIKCIWWDDGGRFSIFDRSTNIFHPQMLEALMGAK